MKTKQIHTRISEAKARIDEAERVLEAALAATEGGQRADKVTVNVAVGEALHQLKDATTILGALQLADSDEQPQ
jgi:hypothetical protein